MHRITAFLMICSLLFTASAQAESYIDESGSVDKEQRIVRKFTLSGSGKTKLKLTVGCRDNSGGKGTMRVTFYMRSPQGGWNQIDKLRLILRNQKERSTTFSLPSGEYMTQITVQRVAYKFSLKDAS